MNDQFFQQKNERKYIRLTQCYDQLYDELFRMEAHAHEGIELMFVREGRINFFFSVAGMVKQYSIAADEFVIFDSIAVNRDWRKIQKKYGKTAQKNIAYSRAITYITKTGDFRLQTVMLPIGRF